jgi:N-acetylglutamate synthase-like GNAT family acetyltransferase
MSIMIRGMGPADVAACRLLLLQLGYDLNPQEVKRRYEAIKEKQDHAVFVCEQDGQVVALLHLYERPAFDKPPEVIVQALVVDQNSRGSGIGNNDDERGRALGIGSRVFVSCPYIKRISIRRSFIL